MFAGGALTSLGPCSLSLLPVTLAYLAGFEAKQPAWQRSLLFCSGIVGALVVLGSLSGLVGGSMARCRMWCPPWWRCWPL